MMSAILSLVVNAVGIFVVGYLLKGVQIKSFVTALGVALLLAVINTFVRPILVFLTFPITLVTFGLFIWVINALMLMLADAFVEGMKIDNFGWALLFSLLLSILNLGFF
jgi:putative membrane protein